MFVPRCPTVFANSMGDWLDPDMPAEWLADMLALIAKTQNLNWLLLTKRPGLFDTLLGRVSLLSGKLSEDTIAGMKIATAWTAGERPKNVWTGTTVENQEMVEKRIPELLKIPAHIHFLSCEPLLEEIYLEELFYYGTPADEDGGKLSDISTQNQIDWVICGGETGTRARPIHPDWVRSLRDQCHDAEIPFFFKSWGNYLPRNASTGTGFDPFATAKKLKMHQFPDLTETIRVGKARAGNLLDGVDHHHFPKTHH
jgi:protein gp37